MREDHCRRNESTKGGAPLDGWCLLLHGTSRDHQHEMKNDLVTLLEQHVC